MQTMLQKYIEKKGNLKHFLNSLLEILTFFSNNFRNERTQKNS